MFTGFSEERVRLQNKIHLRVRRSGIGPAVLLLHGYPQTSACWHLVAPELVDAGYSVVVPDLRGYGGSDKPASDVDHNVYSKREMALDLVLLMNHLGFDEFYLAGHDRGARVAHRLVLDHPEKVLKLAVLDIAPTRTMYEDTNQKFATGYYHWFFLIQSEPLPETLIGADPEFYLRAKLKAWGRSGMSVYSDEALKEYIKYFSEPESIHATCEDYRAAASVDLQHDIEDEARLISCPLLALWGGEGLVGELYDVTSVWQEKAMYVEGTALPCGHFLPEEQPEMTANALIEFFRP